MWPQSASHLQGSARPTPDIALPPWQHQTVGGSLRLCASHLSDSQQTSMPRVSQTEAHALRALFAEALD